LVALSNGEFWVSDEHGPHLVHFDADGKELERISPLGVETGKRHLPAVFAHRRANRGMEGLTISPDGKELVGIMQSTLFNPGKKEVQNTRLTRMLFFDLASGATRQYLYIQEKPWNANSEIVALDKIHFLVIERDGKFSGEDTKMQKQVYLIDINGATDVSGDFAADTGLLVRGKTLEQLDEKELAAAGIKAVQKKKLIDLVATLPNHYPHDKAEGLLLMTDGKHLGVVNDDDFAVTSTDAGDIIQKILPDSKTVDASTLYVMEIPER
jgi:hypothetical protein